MSGSSPPSGVDLLRWPILGRFLRWRHARTTLQLATLIVAIAVVAHGLFGPQIAPRNLATVVTWVHYRGLLVIALLAVGNLFCTACPFVLVRDVARRAHRPTRHAPPWLRGKWLAIALLVAILFTYELFDLWALPAATAWLVVGYFAAALAIDLVFRGAVFCKHLCPIGQFNYAASTLSPFEVGVRDTNVCDACRTADCIAGRRAPEAPARVVQRGCELGLFLPAKVGNIDCTFCLDCVQACPHDNVAIVSRLPGAELVDGRRRSAIGRLAARPDIAALAILFAFGALLNAFAMVSPVYALEAWIATRLGATSELPVLAVMFVAALGVIPLILLTAASAASGWLAGGSPADTAGRMVRYAVALVPFGFGVWLSHYMFHLLTGVFTIVPVVQAAAADLTGTFALGAPLWRWVGVSPGAVLPLQLGCVLLGAFGSLAVAHGISERDYPERAGAATMPWAVMLMLLAAAALWVLGQPMEMRGTEFAG